MSKFCINKSKLYLIQLGKLIKNVMVGIVNIENNVVVKRIFAAIS